MEFIIKESTQQKRTVPLLAEGKFCIELTDPITGRVVEQVKEKNTIFTEALLGGCSYGGSIRDDVSSTSLVTTDSQIPVDSNLPYMMGIPLSYGIPNSSGMGTMRGAYNSANQILALRTFTSTYWKFQYDFTVAQANATHYSIGLTNQYLSGSNSREKGMFTRYKQNNSVDYSGASAGLSDGRYYYRCTDAGIITKHDLWLGTYTTIDISSMVGTSNTKFTAYAPITGKYYIFVYSSTTTLRKMHVFSDNTFSTLETTYSPTNANFSSVSNASGGIVYGERLFIPAVSTSGNIYYADFISNTSVSTITPNFYNLNTVMNNGESGSYWYMNGSCVPMARGKYLLGLDNNISSYGSRQYGVYMLDMSTMTFVMSGVATYAGASQKPLKHPLTDSDIYCATGGGNELSYNCAITAKKLETPVEKTSANGMTITYELELFYA